MHAYTHTHTRIHTYFGRMKVIIRNQALAGHTPGLKKTGYHFISYSIQMYF